MERFYLLGFEQNTWLMLKFTFIMTLFFSKTFFSQCKYLALFINLFSFDMKNPIIILIVTPWIKNINKV